MANGEQENRERRERERHLVQWFATWRDPTAEATADAPDDTAQLGNIGDLLDISESGAFVAECPGSSLQPGDRIQLSFWPDESSAPNRFVAEVRWRGQNPRHGRNGVGVAFQRPFTQLNSHLRTEPSTRNAERTAEVDAIDLDIVEKARVPSPTTEGGAYVVVVSGGPTGATYSIGDELVIGRSPRADIVLQRRGTSRLHARIVKDEEGSYYLEDLGSRNGVFMYGGKRVTRRELSTAERFTVAGCVLKFVEDDVLEKRLSEAQALEGVGRLAEGIAHDINNALNVVLNSAELAHQLLSEDPENVQEVLGLLSSIQTATESAGTMSKQLMGFARPSTPREGELETRDLIESTVRLVERALSERVVLKTELDRVSPIVGNAGRLRQVLLNLCLNARDAMPEGGTLTVRARDERVEEERAAALGIAEGDYVTIEVEDDGQGMSPEVLARICEPYFTTKAPGKGTGLGLAMARAIVNQHGGTLEIRSVQGKGTRIGCILPAAIAQGEWGAEKTGDLLKRGGASRARVLLVEDELDLRMLAEECLSRLGYEVVSACDGVEALDIYREQRDAISMVMLDIMMPHLSGEETYEQLLEINPGVRTLVCSGSGDRRTAGFERAGIPVLHKPYRLAALDRAVRQVLDD